jgi:hypothetical protein
MKKLLFISFLLAFKSKGQDTCKVIVCESDRPSFTIYGNGKHIPFKLTVADTIYLQSSSDGTLRIPPKIFFKYFNAVTIFSFLNPLDDEYFKTPMFTRTRRTLGEYCNQKLNADPR